MKPVPSQTALTLLPLCLTVASFGLSSPSNYRISQESQNSEIILKNIVSSSQSPIASSVVTFNKEELSLYVPASHSLKMLQVTDTHFGNPARAYHNGSPEKTYLLLDYVIAESKPDLLVCTGDNFLGTGLPGAKAFVALMDKYEIPWTFCFGNHDAEGFIKSEISTYLADPSSSKYLLYQDGFIDSYNDRYGNFSLKIRDQASGELTGAIFMLDSGVYDYTNKYYQYISSKQISWYEKEITTLQAAYKGTGVVPSINFQHIQLPEHHDAYLAATQKEADASWLIEYPSNDYSDEEIEGIKEGGPSFNSGFFATLKKSGSCKAVFVGHMHYMRWQVVYQGITLGFGPQLGYTNQFPLNADTKCGYVYQVDRAMTLSSLAYFQPLDIK